MRQAGISQAEAARAVGISRQRVSTLIKQGRLKVDRQRRVRLQDLQKLQASGLDPSRGSHKTRAATEDGEPSTRGFTAARTQREEQLARLAQLDVLKRTGEVMETARVIEAQAAIAVTVRESLLAIPDRLAAVVTAEQDEQKNREHIDREVRAALAALVNSLRARTQ